ETALSVSNTDTTAVRRHRQTLSADSAAVSMRGVADAGSSRAQELGGPPTHWALSRWAFDLEGVRVYSCRGGGPMVSMTTGYVRIAALSIALVACGSGCASDKSSLAQAPPPQSAAAGPRFDQSGPDADEFGAREGYPVGDRNTFFRVSFLVGSQSHQDEI